MLFKELQCENINLHNPYIKCAHVSGTSYKRFHDPTEAGKGQHYYHLSNMTLGMASLLANNHVPSSVVKR